MATPIEPRPWHALGLGAGLVAAALLALAEWLVPGSGPRPLEGGADLLHFGATSLTVYGFVTVPLGLGFGLSLAGLARWLGLPDSWHRLKMDHEYRGRHERNLAALALAVPFAIVAVVGLTFFVQTAFVHKMNNPTLSGAFMALSVLVGLVGALALLGVGVVVFGGLLEALGVKRLARREPRLLRTTLWLIGIASAAGLAGAFALLYDPEVWPAVWVAFLAGTVVLPIALTLSGPLIAWARIFRSAPAAAAVILAYMALSAWTFTGLESWDRPRQAVLADGHFTPTLAGLIHAVTDRDGDGQSRLLGGGDCDDHNAAVYAGAPEVPGNGLDDNCLGGDANPRPDAEEPDGSTLEGTGAGAERSPSEGTGESASAEPVAVDRRRNVVFLLVDTLRPDHLGAFGYTTTPSDGVTRSMSPNLDALAGESVLFTRAYAQSNRTPGSIPSVVFGRYLSDLDLENPTHNYPDVRASNTSLFEVFDEMGYFTMGVAAHYYFDSAPGMQQGFDVFDNRGSLSIGDTNTAISAPEIFAKLEELTPQLAASEEPWALFVHFFEPHSRWMAHPELVEFERAESGRQRHINNYDSEIAFVDQYVGRTLELLRAQGLYDDAIIVLVSDHGEAFNEHGHFFHGQTLYEEVVHVPLFLRVPGVSPAHIETPVALLDVAPTLLDLVGREPPSTFEGHSLVRDFPDVPARDIFIELLPYSNWSEHIVALVRGDLKLHYHVTRRRFELYDLAEDPGERDDVYGDHPATEELTEALVGWLEGAR